MTRKAAPPAEPTRNSGRIATELKRAIRESGHKHYSLGKMADVNTAVLDRFVADERGLTLESIEKLAVVLDLHLSRPARRRGRPPKGSKPDD